LYIARKLRIVGDCVKIKIYTSDHCTSCHEALQYFRSKEMPFELIDVTFNKHHFEEMVKLGGIATPFIIIDEQTFHTFDQKKMEQVLEGK
jgi:glutaredoxin